LKVKTDNIVHSFILFFKEKKLTNATYDKNKE